MPQFAATTKLLGGDLSKANPDTAVKNIDAWEESLSGVDSKEAKTVVKDLDALKKALTASKPNGATISKLMSKLGDETTKLAEAAPDAQQDKLRDIGKALTEAGSAGGED